jgi:hypothetical protein
MAASLLEEVLRGEPCAFALDIGCGCSSVLKSIRPALKTVGLDASAEALAAAKERKCHDELILANALDLEPRELLIQCGVEKFDVVLLFDVLEHLPKRQGLELLERCEPLTAKFIVVHTPNGFLPQGPEFGNEFQRHLSGWFPHDFEGLGYQVAGAGGTKLFHGYAGQFRWSFPGVKLCDALLAALWRIRTHPRKAFSLFAWKDVRGVPARFPRRSEAPL